MSDSIAAALIAATAQLARAGTADPGRDARLLMASALGIAPDRMLLVAQDSLNAEARSRFARMIDARARFQPVAQIRGHRAFWGRDFQVTSDVLDPRPETETLIARALNGPPPRNLLDLGTGSGVILVTLLAEWPDARGVGTDISPAALAVAARNAARHGVEPRAMLLAADWGQGVMGTFDLVVSNPPYIPEPEVVRLAPDVRDWEPRLALTPGPTGLESYAHIAAALDGLLVLGGRALLEIGAQQGAAVMALFRAAGFADVALHRDLDGRDCVVSMRRTASQ